MVIRNVARLESLQRDPMAFWCTPKHSNNISDEASLQHPNSSNRFGGIMVSGLASSVVDRRFEPWSGQTKDYQIGICCFSAKHTALRRKSKDLFQWASTIKIQLSVLVKNKADLIISLKINLFSPWYIWKIAELALNNNHSLSTGTCSRPLNLPHWISFYCQCITHLKTTSGW